MGLRDLLAGRQVYFDADIFIYLAEPVALLEEPLSKLLSLIAAGRILAVISESTLCEVLTKPLRQTTKKPFGFSTG